MPELDYSLIADELWAGVELFEGFFDDFRPSPGWQLLGEVDVAKIKVVSRELELFAKMYAPASGDFAERSYRALNALANLNLPIKVLGPLAIAERTLFFELGRVIGTARYYDYQLELSNQVSSSLGLLTLASRAEIVMVRQDKWLVDVIDDSMIISV